MKLLFTRLWRDQQGGLTAMSQLLLTTILAIGGVVGLATFRDQLVQQFGDVGVALDQLDQSFTTRDDLYGSYEDPEPTLTDPPGGEAAGLSVQQAATPESQAPTSTQ